MSTAALAPRTLADLLPAPTVASQRITRDAALIGGFAALTAVLAQVKFSLGFTPVPITGQTLATLLAGTVLGWKRGAASQFVYWVAGIFMPFAWYANDETGSSISAGWNYAIGTTAGYGIGFILAAALVGALAERGPTEENRNKSLEQTANIRRRFNFNTQHKSSSSMIRNFQDNNTAPSHRTR